MNDRPRSFWRSRLVAIDRNPAGHDQWRVTCNVDTVEVTLDTTRGWRGREERWTLAVSEISKIQVLLQDNYSYDTVWILVHCQAGQFLQFPEEATGFQAFVYSLPTRLTGCASTAEWYGRATQPPLVEKCFTIYERGAV
ncbi:MAG: hypothetical protein U1F30_10985 [Steroidobacteraceae bacterium]